MKTRISKRHLLLPFAAAGLSVGCSSAPTGGGEPSSDLEAVASVAQPITTLASCTRITASGSYVLSADLQGGSSGPCMTIENTSQVTLDCQNHAIVSDYGNLAVVNSSSFTVKNCDFEPSASPQTSPVSVNDSSVGTFTANTMYQRAPASMPVQTWSMNHANRIVVSNSVIYGQLQQFNSYRSWITGNRFACVSPSCGSLIASTFGYMNTIEHNQIDGGAPVQGSSSGPGADDGISLQDESYVHIVHNTISNTWDCGIEWAGTLAYGTVSFNAITNTTVAGIGGWYWMSTHDSTFEGNDIGQTWSAFYFYRRYGLRGPHDGIAADTGVYFTANTFEANVLRNNYSPGLPLAMPFETSSPERYLGYDGQALSGETVPTASQFYLTNNVFVNNDFGLNGGPYFGTATYPGAVVDQGNNTCTPPAWGVSLLACKSTPACTGITASGLATSPSNGLCCSAPGAGLCNGSDGRACVDFQGANPTCQVWSCTGQTCGWQ